MPNRPLSHEDLAHVLEHAHAAFATLRNARLFLTGGTGFFGHWLLESLLYANQALRLDVKVTALTRNASTFRARSPHIANDPAITLLEGDIRSFAYPADLPTHILHAATESSGQLHAYQVAETIIDGTRRVLELARHAGTTRLLYISSGAVYGRSNTLSQIPETCNTASDPLLPQSAYDEAKRMAENLCVTHAMHTPLQPVIARCFAFVGAHLPLDSHFAIGNFIGAALRHTPIHIHGDGTPRRSWLYMADLAVWLWTMLVFGEANTAYNVGSDEAYSIAEVARITMAKLQLSGEEGSAIPIHIHATPDPDALPNSYVPNINRARNELDLRVRIPLAEALHRTAAWHGYRASRLTA